MNITTSTRGTYTDVVALLANTDDPDHSVHISIEGTPLELDIDNRSIVIAVWKNGADSARYFGEITLDDLVALGKGEARITR